MRSPSGEKYGGPPLMREAIGGREGRVDAAPQVQDADPGDRALAL